MLDAVPDTPGSLGIAISEAVEVPHASKPWKPARRRMLASAPAPGPLHQVTPQSGPHDIKAVPPYSTACCHPT